MDNLNANSSLPDFALDTTIAWGDESARMTHEPRIYLLCATVFEPGVEAGLLRYARQKPKRMRKLHWHDMEDKEKALSLAALAEVPHWSTVAIASPMSPTVREERARRKCLERLLPHLEQRGVDTLVLESRFCL